MFHFEIRHVQVHLQVLDWTGNESLTMTHYSGSHLAECYKIIEKYKKENAKLKNRIIELQVELNGRIKLIKAQSPQIYLAFIQKIKIKFIIRSTPE